MAHSITTVTTVSAVDWAATGTMLQGIGTIIGAVAVIAAAIIGGTTFRSWKRQQLLQRHMDLAERILTLAVQAQEEMQYVRGPFMSAAELNAAADSLEANGTSKKDFVDEHWRRIVSAQVTFDRIRRYQETWTGLRSIKHLSKVYFGDDILKQVENIIRAVNAVHTAAEIYSMPDVSTTLGDDTMNKLSSLRPQGQPDELGLDVANAVSTIEGKLGPLLKDAASATQEAFAEVLKKALSASLRKLPFPGI